MTAPTAQPRLRQLLRRLVVMLLAVWLLAVTGLWLAQDWLLFPGVPVPVGSPVAPGVAVREVTLATTDGLALRGWLARPESAVAGQRLPLILYFGGKDEDVSAKVSWPAKLPGWSILVVPYRGYGGNPGKASEGTATADALAVYDQMTVQPDVQSDQVVVVGYSLGTGVALHVAANRSVSRVLLLAPYDSILAVAQRRFPFAPISLLLRNRMDSLGRAKSVRAPVLLVSGANDRVIPQAHTDALQRALGPLAKRHVSATADHNNLLGDADVWHAIQAWLDLSSAALHPM